MSSGAQCSADKKQRRSIAELLKKAGEYRRIFGLRGLWLALRTKMTRAQRSERALVPGTQHKLGIRLNGSDLSTFTKIFIEREYDIPLAKDPEVIVDAGANVGYASACF